MRKILLQILILSFLLSQLFGFYINTKIPTIYLNKGPFSIYYSCNEKKPLLTVEDLTEEMLKAKHYPRKGLNFKPDYELPRKCRSYPNDYSHSGYDRGHNVPNFDMSFNRTYQKKTFLMSNISPQTPSLNRYLWKSIEGYTRYLAVKNKKIKVYTGTLGIKGYLKNHIVIPKYWFKIILFHNKNYIIFLVENKKYKRRRYSFNEIQKFIISKEKFNRIAKDYLLIK